MPTDTPGKVCVFCRQDCSAVPRLRTPDGRYACKACAQQNGTARAPFSTPTPVAKPTPVVDDDALDLGGLEPVDVGLPPIETTAPPCLGCGRPLPSTTVICLGCGYNRHTGKAGSTAIAKPKGDRGGKTGKTRNIVIPTGLVITIILVLMGIGLVAAAAYTRSVRPLYAIPLLGFRLIYRLLDD